MKKILILEQGSEYGGVNKILSLLLESFKDSGLYDCKACFLYKAKESDAKMLNDDRVTYIHNYTYPKSRILRLAKFLIIDSVLILRRLRKEKPDWVVSFGSLPLLQVALFKNICGYKLLVSERNDPYLLNDRIHCIIRRQYKCADRIVFQSKAARDFFSKDIQARSIIIANPVAEPKIRWMQNTSKSIVTVGRIENKQKRGDVLINAFAHFSEYHKEYILEFIGTGTKTDVEYLKKVASENGILDKVFFSGYSSNPIEKLLQAEVFVLSSDYEGMPNALLEAMSIGMPVISTNYSPGGVEEIIKNESGIVIERGDAEGLAKAMTTICDNHHFAVKCGKNAFERMKQNYKPVIMKQWESCFE